MNTFRKILPLLNRVVIKRMELPAKSAGGIILPDNKDKDSVIGQVVATGPGTYDNTGNLIPTRVAEGDHVLLPNYGGTTFEMAEEKYHIFRDTEILGKVEL